jgi:hypothetical protein
MPKSPNECVYYFFDTARRGNLIHVIILIHDYITE